MASIKEMEMWKQHNEKYKRLVACGIKKGYVKSYYDVPELMDKLRNLYFGGLPASILLLIDGLVKGFCYDRALYIAAAYHDNPNVTWIDASIDSIRLNPNIRDECRRANGELIHRFDDHSYVEVEDNDGIVWVYDTTDKLIYQKWFYSLLENPKPNKVNGKAAILEFPDYIDVINYDRLDNDKFIMPIIMGNIESVVKRMKENNQLYFDLLEEEIRLFKEKINFDEVCAIIDEEMKGKGLELNPFYLIQNK